MPDVSFRPVTDADRGFLRELYAGTRREEMALSGWARDDIENFLTQQFEAQDHHYRTHFTTADYDLILHENEPIGRLYLDERDDEFRVIDIALLPAWRGLGIGGRLMRGILDRARAAGKSVRIHVEGRNPAMRLYQRLGFRPVGETGVYQLMEWRAGNVPAEPPIPANSSR